jgi:tetratricopeptide (TPR) repeat protein
LLAFVLARAGEPPVAEGAAPGAQDRFLCGAPHNAAGRGDALAADEADDDEAETARVYQLLLAEIALQRGDADLAVRIYSDLADETCDPKIMERAIEVAGFARRFDDALDIARRWLELDPESARARKMLIGVLVLGNRFDQLPPHLIRLLESDRAALPANLLGLNRTFARSSDRGAVFRLIEAVCQPFADYAEAHYAVALAAGGAGLKERARREARQALDLRPDWETAAYLLAQMLVRDGPRDEAIEFMEGYLENHPDAGQLRLLFARVLVGEHRYTDARKQFDRLLEDSPDDPEIIQAVALLALQFDDRALAEAQFKRYAALDKAPEKDSAWYYLGQIAEEDKRIDEAMSLYERVAGGQNYIPAQARLARLLAGRGQLEEARARLDGARAAKPDERIRLQIVEAGLLREAGRADEAFDFLEARLAEHPENPELMYETALLAEKLGKPELMEQRLRRVIELRPDEPQAYNALGYSYAERNERLPEARRLIEKALAMAPDDGAILDSMGWVLFRQGDLPGALSFLERAWDKREDPEIAAHLGEVLWSMGRKDDARRVLEEAREKYPSNSVLAETARRIVQ